MCVDIKEVHMGRGDGMCEQNMVLTAEACKKMKKGVKAMGS